MCEQEAHVSLRLRGPAPYRNAICSARPASASGCALWVCSLQHGCVQYHSRSLTCTGMLRSANAERRAVKAAGGGALRGTTKAGWCTGACSMTPSTAAASVLRLCRCTYRTASWQPVLLPIRTAPCKRMASCSCCSYPSLKKEAMCAIIQSLILADVPDARMRTHSGHWARVTSELRADLRCRSRIKTSSASWSREAVPQPW